MIMQRIDHGDDDRFGEGIVIPPSAEIDTTGSLQDWRFDPMQPGRRTLRLDAAQHDIPAPHHRSSRTRHEQVAGSTEFNSMLYFG
jgi:hypothetical protein